MKSAEEGDISRLKAEEGEITWRKEMSGKEMSEVSVGKSGRGDICRLDQKQEQKRRGGYQVVGPEDGGAIRLDHLSDRSVG